MHLYILMINTKFPPQKVALTYTSSSFGKEDFAENVIIYIIILDN